MISKVGALLPTDLPLINALLAVAFFVVPNQLEGHVLQPLVMAARSSRTRSTIIVSFLATGALRGIVGALPAVPAAVVVPTLVRQLSAEDPSEETGIGYGRRTVAEPLPKANRTLAKNVRRVRPSFVEQAEGLL